VSKPGERGRERESSRIMGKGEKKKSMGGLRGRGKEKQELERD
jgi:hypothetical protein